MTPNLPPPMANYRYIIPLTGDLSYGRELLGGKAANLQVLVEANFHVPSGFVISTLAFRETLTRLTSDAGTWVTIGEFEQVVAKVPLAPALEAEILQSARALKTLTGTAFVVRSSATTEDHANASMAGQAASFVNIRTEAALLDAVRKCWASLFSREAIAYRARTQGDASLPEMAVIVQQLVPADRAGVIFTTDPVSGKSDEMLISATWGLGEMVVSGRAADTFFLNRGSGKIIRQDIAVKQTRLVPGDGGGTRAEVNHGQLASRPALDVSLAARLHRLALNVEACFGAPQDLEWAEWQGQVYLLQARPVTTTGNHPQRTVWSSTNVGEALPGVGTPFTWSFIRSFSRQGMVHAFRGLGCEIPDHYSIVGIVRGRVYLNLSEFMSVISQIPFVTPDMLQRLAGGGGAEALAGTFTRLPRTRFLVRVPVTALTTVLNRLITPARVALWSPRFKTFNRSFAERRLVALTRAELTALWSETDAVFEETGTLMLECSGEFLMAYLLLSFTLKGFLGARAATFESALFSGLSGIRSAEPGLDLLRMAWRIRDMPELRAQVLAADPGKLPDGLKSGNREARSLYSVIEAFLRNHGHRAAREAELSEPRWREDPTFPLAMLRKYVSARNLPDPDKLIATRINTREESTRQALELLPRFVRGPFHLLLRQTQEGARVREEMRNAVVHTMGFYRTLALEVGRRMVEAGCLQRIEDVFFFTKEELLNWLSGSGDMGRLPLLAAQRRWEHQALAALPDLPPWFEMEGDRIVPEQHPAVTGRVLTGLAGSPGVVTGRAVIVNCPGDHAKVGPGDVLVAPYTDVGWTPLFLIAGAVVTELGGPLSHSCVVAREYGVPAVVNVKAATRLLEDGDEVTVDGDKGVVVVKLKDGHVA